MGEFSSIFGSYGQVPKPIADVLPIRPHHYPDVSEQRKVVNAHEPVDKDVLIGDIQDLCCEGINFLRNEATYIVAFVVADSQRLNRPGIPPHVPIAYAMHGPSFTNESLCKMLTDVYLCCQSHNAGIMCEIIDGEFIKLIHTSENSHPLTHFQHLKAMFKYHEQFSRSQLVDMIRGNPVPLPSQPHQPNRGNPVPLLSHPVQPNGGNPVLLPSHPVQVNGGNPVPLPSHPVKVNGGNLVPLPLHPVQVNGGNPVPLPSQPHQPNQHMATTAVICGSIQLEFGSQKVIMKVIPILF